MNTHERFSSWTGGTSPVSETWAGLESPLSILYQKKKKNDKNDAEVLRNTHDPKLKLRRSGFGLFLSL